MIFAGSSAAGYLLTAFTTSYATAIVGHGRTPVLALTCLAAAVWIVTTMLGGALSDRVGRKRAFQIGYLCLIVWAVPMFLLIDTANIWLFGVALLLLTPGIGIAYGPMSAMYAEMSPVEIRYSGVSIGYALGAVLGGAFAAMITQAIIDATGWAPAVGLYIIVLSLISLTALATVREPGGNDRRPLPDDNRDTAAARAPPPPHSSDSDNAEPVECSPKNTPRASAGKGSSGHPSP